MRSLQGSAGNGSYIEFDFSMTGYAGLTISFQTRGTANGYNSGLWSWSVNGGSFTTLAGVNTATRSTSFSPVTVDFTSQTAIDNAASVRLRYTLSGATDSMQNNRIDDFVISATQVPTVSVVVNDSDAYEEGSQSASITVSSSLSAGAGGLPVHYQTSGSATPPGSPGAEFAPGTTRPLKLERSRDAVLQVPAKATGQPLALLVMLHGAGGSGDGVLRRVAAAAEDALIASAGTHPFSRYENQEVTDRPRYAAAPNFPANQWRRLPLGHREDCERSRPDAAARLHPE
jgi:hypothetical protein